MSADARQCYSCQDDPGCHFPDHAQCPEAAIDELQGTVARLHSSDSTHRRSAKNNYEKLRRLENAIRKHATRQCKCRTDRQCMAALARLVPINARPAYKARRKVAAKNG